MNTELNDHLSQDLIFRTLDDELSPAERFECEAHLAVCDVCRSAVAALHEISVEIESAVNATPVPIAGEARQRIQRALESQRSAAPAVLSPAKVMRRFGWGMGIAASLALGVLLAPKQYLPPSPVAIEKVPQMPTVAQPGSVAVDGETFVSVPYVNSELSTAGPHIVQMQVPVSSLADMGIVVEPVANSVAAERSVLADVLIGADGQPQGVHVLGSE